MMLRQLPFLQWQLGLIFESGFEAWSFNLREKEGLKVFEHRVLRRITEPPVVRVFWALKLVIFPLSILLSTVALERVIVPLLFHHDFCWLRLGFISSVPPADLNNQLSRYLSTQPDCILTQFTSTQKTTIL
jgi:hypothetical protein